MSSKNAHRVVPVVAVFRLGLVLIVASRGGESSTWSWRQLSYDLGMGALVATGIGALLAWYMTSLDRREDRRRDAEEKARERLAAVWQRRFDDVRVRLDDLGADLKHAWTEAQLHVVDAKVERALGMLEGLERYIRQFRSTIDTKYEPPEDEAVSAGVTAVLDGMQRGPGSRLGTAVGRPPAGPADE